jgi:hypothetical protein
MIPPNPSLRSPVLAALALAALLLGGCAAPSSPTAMTATPAESVTPHKGSVAVNVTGGTDTSALGASKISNADFANAISASIEQSKLFERIAAANNASDYEIDAQIVRLEQPMFGASFTVNLEVTWRLLSLPDRKVVWEKAVTSSFTATMGEAFAGVTRLRLANEGAARENIKSAIHQMSALSLP